MQVWIEESVFIVIIGVFLFACFDFFFNLQYVVTTEKGCVVNCDNKNNIITNSKFTGYCTV